MDKDYTETSDIYLNNSHFLQTRCWLHDFSKQNGLKPYLNTELHFLCTFSISSKLHLLHYMRKDIIRSLKQFPICSSCNPCCNKLWCTLTLAKLFSFSYACRLLPGEIKLFRCCSWCQDWSSTEPAGMELKSHLVLRLFHFGH